MFPPWRRRRFSVFWAGLLVATGAVAGERSVVLADHLIDGSSSTPRARVAVLIEDDRITAIGGPDLARGIENVIDLGSSTLLPGLIDVHAHPLISTDDYQIDHMKWSSSYKTLRGLAKLREHLEAGWTTLRVAGDADVHYAVQDLRRAIEEGLVEGPRITGAGHYLSVTGGGGDIHFLSPEQEVIADGLVADGVDEIRKAVRREIKYGADWIKLLVTGAFMTTGDNPANVHFSLEELEVATAEAGRRGVPVMAHAHAAEGIRLAALAGVRSIEHGTFIDDAAIDAMLAQDVFLVPTLFIGEYYNEIGSDTEQLEKMIELGRQVQTEHEERAAHAHSRGVRIALGTDNVGWPAELNVRELPALVRIGLTPMEAIQAATSSAAELLGWEDRIGTIEPGKLADLIAVPGDPLTDLSLLETVTFVMKGGKVIKEPLE